MKRSVLAIVTTLLSPGAFAAELPVTWQPLSAQETARLDDALSRVKPGAIVIACPAPSCRKLADGVERSFANAHWQVTAIKHGGLGIDGVTGLRVDGCGEKPDQLKAAIEKVTSRKIEVAVDGPCHGVEEIHFIIGTPAF